VYCCEEGPDGPSAYTVCHEVIVNCGIVEIDCPADLDQDGNVGVADLLNLLGAYGTVCQ
jgi:hypothetical protein